MASLLVIDDHDAFRTALRELLVEAGYTVVEAREGQEGVQRCQEQSIDLVILDLFMPGMEGFETIRRLQTRTPPVKLIVMSGGGVSGHLEFLSMAALLGAHRTLPKPLRAHELLAAVQEVLGEREGQTAS